MVDGLVPYPRMRESGVAWLGRVPEHWSVRKLKYGVTFSGGGTPSKSDVSFWNGDIPWVSPKDMARSRIVDTIDHVTAQAVKASTTSIVPPGALLIVVRSGILRRTIPVAINLIDVTLNQDMKALRPRAGLIQSDYLLALVQGNEARLIAEWTKHGATVESIEHELMANSPVPFPPITEQTAIARYLTHATRRIHRYISAKQKLIALLEEQRQAIIHRAVTRGLDPDVRMKASGVEWVGEVPEHWDTCRLRAVLARPMRNGLFKKKEDFGSGVPLVNVADIYRESHEVEPESLDRVRATPIEIRAFQVRRGDLFFVRSSLKLEGTGRSAVALECDNDTVFECHLVQGRPNHVRANSRFLVLQLNSFGLHHYLVSRANVVTMATVAQGVLSACPIWLPPLVEQAAIVEHIDRDLADSDRAIRCARREIALLHEYRTRLIADVVTGKLDVREAAARLPDEPGGADGVEGTAAFDGDEGTDEGATENDDAAAHDGDE